MRHAMQAPFEKRGAASASIAQEFEKVAVQGRLGASDGENTGASANY